MESLNFIKEILDGKVVLGKKEEIVSGLFIIPVYRVKMSFLNLKTDLKDNSGDGISGSVNVHPLCLLKVFNGSVDVITLKEDKDNFVDNIGNLLSNIDLNDVFKNIKIV